MADELIPTTPTTTDTAAPATESGEATAATPVTSARRAKKKKAFVTTGQAHIQATYNNTIVTLTDVKGNVIAWSSAGKVGFKGPKKSTPYAAGVIVRDVVERAKAVGLQDVEVFVRGVGLGREAAIRALAAQGLNISNIKDITPVPHNGPRPRKVRRV